MNHAKKVVTTPQKPYLTLSLINGGARNLLQGLKLFLFFYSQPSKQKSSKANNIIQSLVKLSYSSNKAEWENSIYMF